MDVKLYDSLDMVLAPIHISRSETTVILSLHVLIPPLCLKWFLTMQILMVEKVGTTLSIDVPIVSYDFLV